LLGAPHSVLSQAPKGPERLVRRSGDRWVDPFAEKAFAQRGRALPFPLERPAHPNCNFRFRAHFATVAADVDVALELVMDIMLPDGGDGE
jgi:hypothetical protein